MFTAERQQELRDFWYTGSPLRVLAARWHCTAGYVSNQAKRLGLPSRQVRSYQRRLRHVTEFAVRVEARKYFDDEAARRGLYPRELEALLIQIISEDRMVLAVLDDTEQLKEAEAA